MNSCTTAACRDVN